MHKLFDGLTFIGTLLFKEFPSTVIYSNKKGQPVILEWVDYIEEKKIDKYLLFTSSLTNLIDYIEGKISHFDLIKYAESDKIAVFEGSLDKPENSSILSFKEIPISLLPSKFSFFKLNESDDVEAILNHFQKRKLIYELSPVIESLNLNEIEKFINVKNNYKDIAFLSESEFKTELFCVHLNNGKYISHGNAQTNVLGATLISFDELYHEVADDHYKGVDRNRKIKKSDKDYSEYELVSNTEVVLRQAASFEIYIRPKSIQTVINKSPESENDFSVAAGEQIFKEVLNIISKSSSKEGVDSIKKSFSYNVFLKLKDFAEQIKKYELNVNLDYYSPVTKFSDSKTIDLKSANEIINTLSASTIEEKNQVKLKGSFTALNCKTGHYTFLSLEEEESTGYFDSLIKDNMPNLNFINVYEILVSRTSVKNISDSDFKFIDIMLSATDI
jgi:hypothetical protein